MMFLSFAKAVPKTAEVVEMFALPHLKSVDES